MSALKAVKFFKEEVAQKSTQHHLAATRQRRGLERRHATDPHVRGLLILMRVIAIEKHGDRLMMRDWLYTASSWNVLGCMGLIPPISSEGMNSIQNS